MKKLKLKFNVWLSAIHLKLFSWACWSLQFHYFADDEQEALESVHGSCFVVDS